MDSKRNVGGAGTLWLWGITVVKFNQTYWDLLPSQIVKWQVKNTCRLVAKWRLIDCVIFIGQFPEGIPSNQVHGFQTCPHQTDEPYPPPPPRIFHTMLLTNPKKATNMTKVWQRRTASGIWRPAWDLKRSVLFACSRLPSPSMSISSKARSFASPAVESFNSLEPCTNSTISSSVSSQARRISAMSPALSPASSWPRFRRKLGSILGNGASVGLGQRLGVTSCTSLFHEGVIFEVKMILTRKLMLKEHETQVSNYKHVMVCFAGRLPAVNHYQKTSRRKVGPIYRYRPVPLQGCLDKDSFFSEFWSTIVSKGTSGSPVYYFQLLVTFDTCQRARIAGAFVWKILDLYDS